MLISCSKNGSWGFFQLFSLLPILHFKNWFIQLSECGTMKTVQREVKLNKVCDTHLIMSLSISIYPAYLFCSIFTISKEKNTFWKKETLEKSYCLMQFVTMRAEAVFIFFFNIFISNTKHRALVLHTVALNQYFLKNDLGKGANVFMNLFLLSSLKLQFSLHEGSYVHGIAPSSLSLLRASHTTWEMNWKSQTLDSIHHHWTLLLEIIWDPHGFPETKGLQITYG